MNTPRLRRPFAQTELAQVSHHLALVNSSAALTSLPLTCCSMSSRRKVRANTQAFALRDLSYWSFLMHAPLSSLVWILPGYQKPYLMLYFAHSSFVLLLPLHLLYLRYASPLVSSSSAKPSKVPSTRSQLRALRAAIHNQLVHGSHAGVLSLSAKTTLRREEDGEPFPWIKAFGALILVTALLTLPAGLWYAAVPLTS